MIAECSSGIEPLYAIVYEKKRTGPAPSGNPSRFQAGARSKKAFIPMNS